MAGALLFTRHCASWERSRLSPTNFASGGELGRDFQVPFLKKGRVFLCFFFCVFRGPGAVKQEKTSRNTETNSKMKFIFEDFFVRGIVSFKGPTLVFFAFF